MLAQNSVTDVYRFTSEDALFLSQFSINNLGDLPPAPSNRWADHEGAAAWGQTLFFDPRLSANGSISCAFCHQPERAFSDGLFRAQGLGPGRRNTPSLLGSAYGAWQYHDGRKDSLWAQALGPLEDPVEMGMTPLLVNEVVATHYRKEYVDIFGAMKSPQRVFVNVGKAIMAYERRLKPGPSRFDRFVDELLKPDSSEVRLQNLMSAEEVQGMRLFVGKARCASCHNGALFTNFEFHNIGAPESDEDAVDLGRYRGIESLRADDFTCMSQWSDAKAHECGEMQFLKSNGPELVGAFKTPSLRNVGRTAPYMHAGQFGTLAAVVAHYNKPTPPFYDRAQHPSRPHFDIVPLGLSAEEQAALVAFLKSLDSI